jgi:hypothetical protein
LSGPAGPTDRPVHSSLKMEKMEASSSPRWGRRPGQVVGKLACAIGLALWLLAASEVAFPVTADEPNQAGLVIQFSDDRIETKCIPLEAPEMAGNDFLARSGLDLVIDATSGLGITVCEIEGQGCFYPAEHCFCQCMGGEDCHYWNYFYREPGDDEWTYSALGILLRQVQPGAVEAWVWGNGQTPPDKAYTFEAICSPGGPAQPSPTPAPSVSSPTPIAGVLEATAAVTAAPMAPATATVAVTAAMIGTAAPAPTSWAEASPTTASPESPAGRGGYGIFALLMVGLLSIGVVAWLLRR